MTKTSRGIGRAVCTAAALAAVVAVPATADAKPKPKPLKQATFKATLSGSQVTTWEYHHAKDKNNPCDASANGNGDQTIKFDAKRRFRITFTQPPKNNPDIFGTAGQPAVLTAPLYLTADATAERNGEESVNAGEIDHNACPGDNGGADPGYEPPPSDCGRRTGIFKTRLYFRDNSEDADLFVPLPGGQKNQLTLDGWQYDWTKADGSGSESELRNTYERCPFHLKDSYPDEAGHIYISRAKLNEKALFDKKRKKFVVSGDHIAQRGGDETSGQTILAWNLRLTRVK
ncbi:MAG: hypothetical protein QOJ57_2255 [Thermoleophilaceae bacterium]|nr:hypothetical protein [Thermoleophilaceae bacterium]